MTFSSGPAEYEGGSPPDRLKLWATLSGRADEVAGNHMAVLGIWEILSQTQMYRRWVMKYPW